MTNLDWLEEILGDMRVQQCQGRFFECKPEWNMVERIITDDMFFYVMKGTGRMTVADRAYRFRPGICGHFRKQIRHSASHDPQNPITVLTLHYTATVLESLTLAELLGFPDFFSIEKDLWLETLFQRSLPEKGGPTLGYGRSAQSITSLILLHLTQKAKYRKTMALEFYDARHDDLRRLFPALKRMRSNLGEPESIEGLARLSGLSLAQFRRIFSRSLHVSPVQYLRRLRLERACWLLRQTTKTIDAIAAEVGYVENAFFAHTFKKAMGVSPGRFRSRLDL